MNKETQYGRLGCPHCLDPYTLPGEHTCKPSYIELKALISDLEGRLENMQDDNVEKEKRIKELEDDLLKANDICVDKTHKLKLELQNSLNLNKLLDERLTELEADKEKLIKNSMNVIKVMSEEHEAQLAEYQWVSGISGPVIEFAKTMQFKLDKNKHKACDIMNPDGKGRHWRHCDIEWLLGRLREETIELEEAIDLNKGSHEIRKECGDIGNFAMMVHDNTPLPKKAEACLMPEEMKSHWFEHCDSDKPTANCLQCENWKGASATFLPACKFRGQFCNNPKSEHYNPHCSKRCKCPEPKKEVSE